MCAASVDSPKKSKKKTPLKTPLVIIAGMGPGGLVAAIEALKKGYQILIIEKRDNFIREQEVFLDPGPTNYLKGFTSVDPKYFDVQDNKEFLDQFPNGNPDKIFFQELYKSVDRPIPLNMLQNYLLNKLDPDGSKRKAGIIRLGEAHEIIGFDLANKKNIAKIKSGNKVENVEFDHFVAADGAARLMSQAINKAWEALPLADRNARQNKPLIENKSQTENKAQTEKTSRTENKSQIELKKLLEYKDLEIQYRTVPQATLFLRPSPEYDKKKFLRKLKEEDLEFSDISDFSKLGWDFPFIPKHYMVGNADRTKIYLAGEIPQKIFEMENIHEKRKEMEKWGKLLLKKFYSIPDADARFELDLLSEDTALNKKKNDLKATTFMLNLKYTETPLVELDNHSLFVCIGDAYMNANFYKGHGANDAMIDAYDFIAGLPEAGDDFQFDGKKFLEGRVSRRESLIEFMQGGEEENRKTYERNWKEYNRLMIENAKILLGYANEIVITDPVVIRKKKEYQAVLDTLQKKILDGSINGTTLSLDLDAFYEKTMEFSEVLDRVTQIMLEDAKPKADKGSKVGQALNNKGSKEGPVKSDKGSQGGPVKSDKGSQSGPGKSDKGSQGGAVKKEEKSKAESKSAEGPARTQIVTEKPPLLRQPAIFYSNFQNVAKQLNQALAARTRTYQDSLKITTIAHPGHRQAIQAAIGMKKLRIQAARSKADTFRAQAEQLEYTMGMPKNKLIDEYSAKLSTETFNIIKKTLSKEFPKCRITRNSLGQIEFSGHQMAKGAKRYIDLLQSIPPPSSALSVRHEVVFVLEAASNNPNIILSTLESLYKQDIDVQKATYKKDDKSTKRENLDESALHALRKQYMEKSSTYRKPNGSSQTKNK